MEKFCFFPHLSCETPGSLVLLTQPKNKKEGALVKTRRKPRQVGLQFGLYLVCLVCIATLLCFTLVRQSQNALLDYALLYASKSNEALSASFQQATEQITSQFSALQYDDSFRSIMELETYAQLTPSKLNAFHDTLSARLSLPTGGQVSLSATSAHYSPVFLTSQLEQMDQRMESHRNVQVQGVASPGGTNLGEDYLVFGYSYYVKTRKAGNVYISLNLDDFTEGLTVSEQPGISFFLVDDQGNAALLGYSAPATEPASESAANKQEELKVLTQILRGDISAKRYVTEETSLSYLNCTLYSIVDTDEILQPVRHMYTTTFSLLFLLIVICLIGNLYLSRNVVQPLSRFGQYLRQLRSDKGLLTKSAETLSPSGCAEIQEIECRFSELLDSIADLNTQVQEKTEQIHQAELLRKDVEIQHLRSQINPHFLYNTLELIRSDAMSGRISQVSAITAAMGKFYRYSIKGSPIVTLKEEMEHVKAYITIQQERFDGKIAVFYNISPEAEKLPVPKMILQPLVENAIVHGLEPANSGGILFIGAAIQEGKLTISVRDSGIGIPPEKLEQLRLQLKHPAPVRDSVGIANVSQRIRLQYGEGSRFHIESTPDDGTCISLELPISE